MRALGFVDPPTLAVDAAGVGGVFFREGIESSASATIEAYGGMSKENLRCMQTSVCFGMQIKTPPIPNLALQQVREATGLTQGGFSDLVDYSRAYVQAVELGQRDASPEFVNMTTMMTGVWPICIAAKWREAVGFDGEPYTRETYLKFKSESPNADSLDPAQIDAMLEPAKRVIIAAARRGKMNMAFYYFRDALVRATATLLRFDARIGDEFTGGEKMLGKLKVGDLRTNPQLAAAVHFVDDARLDDDEEIPLASRPKAIWGGELYPSTMPGAWEEIERKYRERTNAGAGESKDSSSHDRSE